MSRRRRAFTVTELFIIVIVVGVLAVIAMPRLDFSVISKQSAEVAARRIVTDLRRTRRLAISHAARASGFKLVMTGSAPYTGYEIISSPPEEVLDSYSLDPVVSCAGGNLFQFGPKGELSENSSTWLTVSSKGKRYIIRITRATGMVECKQG